MFCSKCGGEIKNGAKFCPVCGTAVGKKPAGEVKKQSVIIKPVTKAVAKTAKDASAKSAFTKPAEKIDSKKWMLPLAALAGVAVVILTAVFLFQPRLKEDKARELIETYFKDQEEYGANTERYASCFRYTINDLTEQLSGRLTSMLDNWGMDTSGINMDSLARQIGSTLSDYFSSDASNQITLAEAIIAESSYEVGKVRKQDGAFCVEVTVTGLDITEVNSLLIDDSVSTNGFVKMAVQFAFGSGGGFLGNMMDMAGGDLSFVLDSFVSKAKTAERNHTYTGIVEFEYDKETKEWEISKVDSKLLDAYYGMN